MPEMNDKLRGELEEILENVGEAPSLLGVPNQSQNGQIPKLELRHAAIAFGALQFIRFLKRAKTS